MHTRLALILVCLPWIAVHRSASAVISATNQKRGTRKSLHGDWSPCISTIHGLQVKDSNSVAAAGALRSILANRWRRMYVSEWVQLQDAVAEWHSTQSTAGGACDLAGRYTRYARRAPCFCLEATYISRAMAPCSGAQLTGSAVVIDRSVSR